jgi:hypothetical protein
LRLVETPRDQEKTRIELHSLVTNALRSPFKELVILDANQKLNGNQFPAAKQTHFSSQYRARMQTSHGPPDATVSTAATGVFHHLHTISI